MFDEKINEWISNKKNSPSTFHPIGTLVQYKSPGLNLKHKFRTGTSLSHPMVDSGFNSNEEVMFPFIQILHRPTTHE